MRTTSSRRIGAVALVLGTALGTSQVASAGPPADHQGEQHSVTLVTGDRVITGSHRTRLIVPGKGREGMAFATYQQNSHLFVVPRDAAALVARGQLDERLFDITTLLESGYDDAHLDHLPLIVTYPPGRVRAGVAGTSTTADLPSVNASAVAAPKTGTAWQALSGPGFRKIWLDGVRRATLDRSTAQIGAPTAWQAGYTGTGVRVAVLDSGVDQTHPDLASREVGELGFTGAGDVVDRIGHGTHVASTIAGTGARFRGVAHGAQILDAKVFDDSGAGRESWIIGGMQWAVAEGAKVVNMSFSGSDTPVVDPVEEAVDSLSAQHGTLFVVAAGNKGPGAGSVGSPGSAQAALTVGAVDRNDELEQSSGRGPRAGGAGIKPDITAPGAGITAARAARGWIGDPAEPGYVRLSGTSVATAHVTGAAAVLAQLHPDWSGARIKAALTGSAEPGTGLSVFDQGSGRVDVVRALTQPVTALPPSISFGTQLWPHDDDRPLRRPLSYTNSGDADVTLDVALRATGPDGGPAPAGLLTVQPRRITVPARGTATVTVTSDTRIDAVDGTYSGTVVATGAGSGTTVTTPLSIHREPESYNVTINHIGRDGAPTADYMTFLIGLDSRQLSRLYEPDGSLTLRLLKGNYTVDSSRLAESTTDWLTYPVLAVARDLTVDLDFRQAEPTRITPSDPTAAPLVAEIAYTRRYGDDVVFAFGWSMTGRDPADLATAHLGPALPPHRFTTQINTQWLAPNGDFHALAWYHDSTLPTGFTRRVERGDLAHVHATFGAPVPGKTGVRHAYPHARSSTNIAGASAAPLPVQLPGDRHEYYTTENALFHSDLHQMSQDGVRREAALTSPVRAYRAGRTYRESYNRGVFGPALPETAVAEEWLTRSGNTISVTTPLHGDGAGNAGDLRLDRGTTTLHRDGEKIGESSRAGLGSFTVPAEEGEYRLAVEGVRGYPWDVSTRVGVAWTFRSAAPPGAAPVRLPISTVRYLPALDAANSAPAGEPFLVPVAVQPQASGTTVLPRTLTVEASYDSGRTWQAATVVANVLAVLEHPSHGTTVSLRAKATDQAGNTVEQTIIDAYKLR